MASRGGSPDVRVRSHVLGRGNRRLDEVLEFTQFAARPMPLVSLLDEAPRRVARILEADVASLYLVEGDGHELVMRGNVGFGGGAVGRVRLAIGEGITGQAVEYLRPVTSERATEHDAYKHFASLGEERYPIFLAVPFRGRSGPLGAIVVQRAERVFEERDVELLTALGAVIGAGVRHAELIDAHRERPHARHASGGTRKVTLAARPFVAGRALGAVAALRRPGARPSATRLAAPNVERERRALKAAFETAEKAIRALAKRARALDLGKDAQFLSTYVDILGDARLRERAMELVAESGDVPSALSRVAREVTRTAASMTKDPFLEERARDVEDLCDALVMLAATDRRAELPTKAVVVGEALTVFDLLITARAQPVAVALGGRAEGPRTRTLLRLLDVPSIVGVEGLFRWAEDGDIALVDGDHGLLVINPSKSEVSALREYRREQVKPT